LVRLAAIAEEPRVGSILVRDVEELRYSIAPWQLQINQLSSGQLHASITFAQCRGILLTRESWSKRVAAFGMTPPGYVVIAGPSEGTGFSWCGSHTSPHLLAYSYDSSKIDFVTLDAEEHWVALIPVALLEDYFGAEPAVDPQPTSRHLRGDSRRLQEFSMLVQRTISLFEANSACGANFLDVHLLEKQLLGAAADLILDSAEVKADPSHITQRFLAYQLARSRIEHSREQISMRDLEKEFGISRRSLELAFKEAMAISPSRYSRFVRLNGLYRQLLQASPQVLGVAGIAQRWGFREYGRAAGYYKDLFDELPHETLARDGRFCGVRLEDVLP